MARRDPWDLLRTALRAGVLAGLAMIPFAAFFRGIGWRVNEYGRKTLELVVGQVASPQRDVLMFFEHMAISVTVAVPFALVLRGESDRGRRMLAGVLYGLAFYVGVNSFALPIAFGDPTPWTLGFTAVFPSLFIHLVYGIVLGAIGARSAAAL